MRHPPLRVLVATDATADQRKTLAAVRALGRNDARVTVGSDHFPCAPALSRHCSDRVSYASPGQHMPRFVEDLRRALETRQFDVLLPLSDYTTIAAVRHRDALGRHVAMALPPVAAFETALDKLATQAHASGLGLDVPVTHCPADATELERISREIDYPCVFKLRRGSGGIGLRFPASADELRACFRHPQVAPDVLYDTSRPLIQEWIPGRVHDVCLLFDRGRVRAACTQVRLTMLPASGGPGIHNRTTDRAALRDQAVALLESLRWHGPAAVEFRRDTRDGRYKLLEINPRFWGTLDLAIHAGMDFPWLTCRLARGETLPPAGYRSGVEYRWLLPHALRFARDRHRRWRTMWRLLAPGRGKYSELRWTDPRPHALDLLELVRG